MTNSKLETLNSNKTQSFQIQNPIRISDLGFRVSRTGGTV